MSYETQVRLGFTNIASARVWQWNFPDMACSHLQSGSSTTLTILTRYTDLDIRHELCALVLASFIYRPAVSRMPFISSFTVLRHDLRCIRMRNDGIARAPCSLVRFRLVSFLPSFLPSPRYGFRRVSVPRL